MVVYGNNDAEMEMDILGQFGMDIEANKKMKEKALSLAELNAKFKQNMEK